MSSIIVFVRPDLNVCEAATNSLLVYLRGRPALFTEPIDLHFELPGGAYIEVGDEIITLRGARSRDVAHVIYKAAQESQSFITGENIDVLYRPAGMSAQPEADVLPVADLPTPDDLFAALGGDDATSV